MFSFFKSRNESRPLDGYLVRYLAANYQMTPDETGKLHFVTTKESLAGKNVTLFRIFDPAAANGADEKVTYQALDDHRPAVAFEGRFAPNKTVTEINDLRRSG